MTPSDVIARAREAVIEMRRIDADLEMLASRVGGQGTGFGTSIDHSTILDVNRNLDDYIDKTSPYTAEGRELLSRYRACEEAVVEAEGVIAGAEAKIAEVCMANGGDVETAYRNAHDMCYELRAYYVEARTDAEICRMTGYGARVNDEMRRVALRFLDGVGMAHLRAKVEYDDRTPEQLRREYGSICRHA